MEAPDKLFIKPEQIKVEMIPGGELPNVGIQYIRKNLLLEWAKEQEVDAKLATTDGIFYSAGREHAFHELIDKLNSL